MKRIQLRDLDAGCLTSPYNNLRRRIWYLDDLVPDIELSAAQLYWANLPPGRHACCFLRERLILLSPTLYTRSPIRVRRALTHELTHVLEGRSCEDYVTLMQWKRYQHLLVPAWLAA